MGRVIRFLIFLVLSPLLYTLCVEAYFELRQGWNTEALTYTGIGGIGGTLLLLALRRWPGTLPDNLEFLEILRHEMTHAFAALLVGSRVNELVVTNPQDGRSGAHGKVNHVPAPLSGPFITLAPYCVPTFTIPFALLRLATGDACRNIIDIVIGFTLAFHYLSVFHDLQAPQSDISRTGYLFSLGFVVVINLVSVDRNSGNQT
jgi:hypothetical protein